MPELLVIIPSYGQLDYAVSAAHTVVETVPGAVPLLVDDHSPEWDAFDQALLPKETVVHRFGKNGGLTRSWNYGLGYARQHGFRYACCTNSDVLFTPQWWEATRWVLDHGVHLAGPLTNAPGHQPRQQVQRYLADYKVTDDPTYLAAQAARLYTKHRKTFVEMRVNGFCMTAKTDVWWAGAYGTNDVFNPKHRMTKNEDELQGRWGQAGRVSALVPASFVFHYRGVTRKGATRGREGKGWFRKTKPR